MVDMFQDIRFALRGLRRKPLFTLIAISTLGLGIGAVVTIFTAVQAVLLQPLPFPEPSRLVTVWQDHTRVDGPIDEWVSADNFFVWRDTNHVFDGIFLIGGAGATLQDGAPEMINGGVLSHDALEILGVTLQLGRGFEPSEDVAGAAAVALLGHDLWVRRFAGSEQVLGRKLTLDGVPTTVVGVLPEGFEVPGVAGRDIFLPAAVDSTNSCGHGCVTFRSIARLAPGVSLDQAQDNMDAIAASLAEEFPVNRDVGIYLQPLADRVTGPYRSGLWLLFGAVGAVLLIACANVANLTLARAAGREQEMAVRVALGAGQSRVVRQLLTESMVVAAGGALAGLAVSLGGVRMLRLLAPQGVTRWESISIDATTILFAMTIAVLTGLLFGTAPALRTSSVRQSEGLTVRSDGGRSARLRGGLVVAEVALATALLIGGGLLARSFAELTQVDPGFRTEGVLTQQLFLPRSSYEAESELRSFVERTVSAAESLPGVEAAGMVNSLPLLGNDSDNGFLIEGRPLAPDERAPVAWTRVVTPGYIAAVKLRLVSGRLVEASDHAEAGHVVMANEAAARRYWPEGDALGAQVRFSRSGPAREVVGVIADTRHFGLTQQDRPALYVPFDQQPQRFLSLVLRTGGDPTLLASAVQASIFEIDPTLAVSGVATMQDVVDRSVSVPRMLRTVLLGFAGVAMLLAAVGIYGVMTYTVTLRIPEMGLRLALGASPAQVLEMVLRSGAALVGLGLALGLGLSLGLSRLLERLLFGVSTHDPLTFAAVPVILTVVALLACLVPAVRAMRIDPLTALRHE